ncbi:GtrA family protein [Ahrensia kielensis]|uniref:GtrA family protein n=1 Tax=Ahrensia kielensis TaxID=76980 RepID=A0ABU9T758_9HYPH
MQLVAKSKAGKIFAFAVAGGSGFVIDIGVLFLLLHLTPLGPIIARIVSILCAMISNFFINRTFTFGQSERSLREEFIRYASVGAIGALLNYLIYVALLFLIPGFSPFLATFIGVIIVAIFSYFGYSRFVFNRKN